ncbi:MAGUK p55 subfamily member 7 [Parasteatoda tepidariorum]|uniref:Putative calcium/calmodulin-dependent serine protein kinase/membrane-associated guanylate kinase n=1 Tax=Parasteatoda tepidariorum TaxID=114398 RepID=A0A2L2YBD6_PARTP|nr:MAGUK p55 subfamily member 7 isoform X2 [Parasteatoda tepidariorum]
MVIGTESNIHIYDKDIERLLVSLDKICEKVDGREADVIFLRHLLQSHSLQALVLVHNRVSTYNGHQIRPAVFQTSSLSEEIVISLESSLSSEARELSFLLQKPHFQALLATHDLVAKKDFDPALPEIIQEGDDDEETVKIVQLVKSNEPLGATIRYDETTGSIVIARVLHGGAADRSGLIHAGDEIHEVNGINIKGKSPYDVVTILQCREGPITFKIVPKEECVPSRESRLRVRAHFCYDPFADSLIPCKEAGLPFYKGDVLHIVNQEDLNWWQARKHGEKNSRAGLIPSRQLQERRFAEMRDLSSLIQDDFVAGCKIPVRKDHRPRKIKKIMYDATENDDFDREEIATYEEVARLNPRPGLHRPIILIGPPGVGRNELKRRLIASDPDHFRQTIPHTSRPKFPWEIDGKEYFFSSRESMQEEIKMGWFVEYGQYKGNLYGTSLETVKSIINAGYVCVMTPHPQALKVLRTPEIKPYLIFIKPPPLEILKETRIRANARSTFDQYCSRGFTDGEFHEIVYGGHKLEFLYGHMFDAVIVNDDLLRAFQELLHIVKIVERVPQWVPASWVASS